MDFLRQCFANALENLFTLYVVEKEHISFYILLNFMTMRNMKFLRECLRVFGMIPLWVMSPTGDAQRLFHWRHASAP